MPLVDALGHRLLSEELDLHGFRLIIAYTAGRSKTTASAPSFLGIVFLHIIDSILVGSSSLCLRPFPPV